MRDAVVVFAALFTTAMVATSPDAPVRHYVTDQIKVHTTDQNYRSCGAARAAGRQNIAAWDPSYRAELDRDRDGLACEPYR